jgi:ACDE family multidrug resistance protein
LEKILKNKNIYIVFSITLIAVMGVATITPAFPSIMKGLELNGDEVGLLISLFTLPGIIFTPIMGVLADKFGRKKILVPSLLVFAVSGSAIAFTQNFDLILVFRFIQGIGAGSLGALNVTVIADLFKGRERGEAMGINASVLSIGTASYPLLGGGIAMLDWHYVFLLPLLAIPVAFFIIFSLELKEVKNSQNIKDYFSQVLKELSGLSIILLFTSSIVTFSVLYGAFLLYFPILLDIRFGLNSFQIGLFASGMSIVTAISSAMLGKSLNYFSEKQLMVISFLFYSASMLIFAFTENIALLIVPVIIFGIAHGINIPVIQKLIADYAPVKQRAAFMSFNGTVLRIGMTLGPLFSGLFFSIGKLLGVFISASVLMASFSFVVFLFFKPKNQIND